MMSKEYESPLHCNISTDDVNNYYSRSLEYLLIVAQNLSQARSLDKIMEIALATARKIAKSDGATFVLLDHGFCYYADENAIVPLWKGQRVPINYSIAGWIMLNSQPVIITDIYDDERIIHSLYKNTFVKSMAMVSLCYQKPIGTIGVYWQNHHEPSIETVRLLQTVADLTLTTMENFQLYSALERQLRDRTTALDNINTLLQKEMQSRKVLEAEIRVLSLTDELTGIHNRRGFFLLAEQQIRLARRSRTGISILFVEIEGLKNIQDTWGPECKDDAILTAARLLKRTCRNADTIGRLEEGEFVILAQSADPHCQIIRQRLKDAIDQFNASKQQPFILAMNVGVKPYEPKPHLPLDDMIYLAQNNIYQSQIDN